MEPVSQSVEMEPCEAIGSGIVWSLRELGKSMKQMSKCEADISEKLKTMRGEINLVISTSKMAAIDNMDALAVASFVFLLKKVVEKVEELTKEVEQLGDLAAFPAHSTLV